jgi:hypothetical protein
MADSPSPSTLNIASTPSSLAQREEETARERSARAFLKMSPEEVQAFLDRVRRYAGPEDYRKIEGWAKVILYVKERVASEDATLDEIRQGVKDRWQAIAGPRVESGRPCAR